MERRRFSQTIASEWQNVFGVSHKMPLCVFTAVQNYNKSLEKLQDFFLKTETKTKSKCSRPRPRLIFVLEAPRDQDRGLEDYITDSNVEHCNLNSCNFEIVLLTLCHIKIHNYEVDGQKTRRIKVSFLYPKCTKTPTSICRIDPGPPVKRGWR